MDEKKLFKIIETFETSSFGALIGASLLLLLYIFNPTIIPVLISFEQVILIGGILGAAIRVLLKKIIYFYKRIIFKKRLSKDIYKNIKMVIDCPYISDLDKGKFISIYNMKLLNLSFTLKDKKVKKNNKI